MRFSAFKPFPRQTNGHRGIYVDAIFIPKGCSLDERKVVFKIIRVLTQEMRKKPFEHFSRQTDRHCGL